MRKYNLLVSKFVIKGMELVYIYHSGFALLGDGYTVIMDYYRDTEDKQAEAALRRLMNERIIAETRKTVCAGQSFSSRSFQ